MISTPKHMLRTSRQASWFLVGIPAVSLATVLLPIAMGIPLNSGSWVATTTIAILLITAILLVKTTTLSLTQDAITYRSLLRRVHIDLTDVVKVECAFSFVAFSYKPYQRIVITVQNKSSDKEIILNGGLFDQREIKKWVDACHSVLHRK
ncbi:hypothetical protein [Thiobacillus thioparus]|uniref:hypothetical protein n=1 Tax=Thiobacillus thioparus TaxID=931 RepID=UPI0012F77B00|nr:hypothetical protein [Thiobacillus thioparus]